MAGRMQDVCKMLFIFFAFMTVVYGDTPANCTYEDIKGKWTFYIGQGNFDNTINCQNFSGLYQLNRLFGGVHRGNFDTQRRDSFKVKPILNLDR